VKIAKQIVEDDGDYVLALNAIALGHERIEVDKHSLLDVSSEV
jgi:hypothetical protein